MGNDIYYLFAVGSIIAAYVGIAWHTYNKQCAAARKKFKATKKNFIA